MIAVGLRTTSVILGKTRASLYCVCRSTTGFHRPLPGLIDVVHRHTLVPVIPKTKQAVPPAAAQGQRTERLLKRDGTRLIRRSSWATDSPMSQSIGGQRPTKSARRSAFTRSSSPVVLARIHSTTQRPTLLSESVCR